MVFRLCKEFRQSNRVLFQVQQAQFPFSKSGFGLRPLERICDFAFTGSAAAIAPLWPLRLGDDWKDRCPAYCATLIDTIDRARTGIEDTIEDSFFPDDSSDFWDFYTTGSGLELDTVQGALTSSHEAILFASWEQTLSSGDRARVISSRQKFASAWLQAASNSKLLPNNTFVTAARLRLGYSLDHRPSSGDPFVSLSDKSHAPILKKLRHKEIAKNIASWCIRAGAERAETEPEHLWTVDNKRPDIDVQLGQKQFLVDVAVVHITAPSYCIKAQHPFGGSQEMVKTKMDRFCDMAAQLDAAVCPAVLESFGAVTQPLIDLFKAIANHSQQDPYCLWSWNEIYFGLVLETSLLLQIGNAKVLQRKRDVNIATRCVVH